MIVKPKKDTKTSIVEIDVFNKFSKYGCKLTSAAVIVGLASGKDIDLIDINEFDKDKDGNFGSDECLEAFNHYLSEGDSVSVKRYENNESTNQFDKETFDKLVESGDEVYIMARATTGHWIVLKGYDVGNVTDKNGNVISDEKKVKFDFKGSSLYDKGRTYMLGNTLDKKNDIYGIDCIEVYTVKRG